MDIYLIRHADALPEGVNGIQTDEERPLSNEGRIQAAQLGKALKKRGVQLDLIASSPLVRAMQTANDLKTELGMTEQQLESCEELAPGGRRKKLAQYMNGLQGSVIGLVGHQPDISSIAGWLMGDKELQIHFAKASVALIRTKGSFSKGTGALICLIPPEWIDESVSTD